MSTLTLTLGRPTLADTVFSRSLATDITLVAAGAALTAVMAQVVVPLYPVPITGQTLAVLLVGASLGATRGAISMTLYALLGLVGLPVFSEASSGVSVLAGTTGGYIIGFIFAAGFTGWLAQRDWDKKFLGAALSFLGGTVVTFAFGLTWLAIVTGGTLEQVLAWGLYPFIIGGLIKAGIAAAVIPTTWKIATKFSRKQD
ncbi:biotin transporter BioY [Salinibacterium sp. NSLL150]|uniref:biotin transporter BioY n=1 Tax=unclassified Salinibacterium TaxID=2632331 RepID=UPI0018CEB01B|nr:MULTISPECIES: biotin transporter BioY [unclassified Salinibacterium]MBH0098846.1 biotin transporter BioY [Salinibacterium sp. NSLL35]MBH0101601.1 biotin transporter BioY [Salinibacterium sp. NSLL150]MBH0104360.1 biotin transporter BioY [Salinibacterium sp. NSLL16]MBH0107121.1 biotin transporter BioY [Salinibacterium sp. NSLL17]MBH0109100.1 biotin transporter BioY [Salinibacterium sp. NG22]